MNLVKTAGALLCALACGACDDRTPRANEELEEGCNALVLSQAGEPQIAPLREMRWQDVSPTARAAHASGVTAKLIAGAAGIESSPLQYLVGLLELSLAHPEKAAAVWSSLDPFSIPGDYLYAPWRLANALRPGEANPFEKPLAQAVREKELAPLIRARFLAAKSLWAGALESYLLTDPEAWTRQDMEFLRRLRRYAPAATEVKVFLSAALRGGRIPLSLRQSALAMIESDWSDAEGRNLRRNLAGTLADDPRLAREAVEAATRQLRLRVAFGEGRFGDVVAQTRESSPVAASNETVMLTFLAATKVGEESMSERWGQELRRRNPGKEIQGWIEAVRK